MCFFFLVHVLLCARFIIGWGDDVSPTDEQEPGHQDRTLLFYYNH